MNAAEDRIQTTGLTEMPCPANLPPKIKRFTLDGSDDLECHLGRICETVLASMQEIIRDGKLEALALGGGYGRGEGGVLKSETGDQPYNDLEFYVFIRGNHWSNERRYGDALHHLSEELAPIAGIEVEFKISSLARLRRSPASMFYYDLLAGHRQLCGGRGLFSDCAHHRDARSLPLSEATRLLMNRCSGLLFAREKLGTDPLTAAAADFIRRNLAKAQLALGDAVLTAFNQYHWSCLERHRRLKQLVAGEETPWLPEVLRHHAAGLRFKLHPDRTAPAAAASLQSQFEEISALALQLWLWLESRRLNHKFDSARDYVLCPANKCRETNPWRNRLVNAKVFGPAALFQKRSHRHPREKVLNALAILLWEPAALDSGLVRRLQSALPFTTDAKSNPVDEYEKLWRHLT
jgi:hypothetical protein